MSLASNRLEPSAFAVWSSVKGHISDRIGRLFIYLGCFGAWTNIGLDIGIQQLSINQLASVLAFSVMCYQWVRYPQRVPEATLVNSFGILTAAIAMLAIICASMASAEQPFDTLRSLGRWVYGLMFLFAIRHFVGFKFGGFKPLILSFLMGGAVTAALCVLAMFYRPLGVLVFQDLYSFRAQGLTQHPNQLAMLYLAATMISFWPGLAKTSVRLAVIGTMLAGVLITGSKTNLALAALAVPAILFWLPSREGQIVQAGVGLVTGLIGSLIAGAAALFYLQNFNNYYYEKLVSFASDPNESDSATSRFDMWNESINCMLEHPVFGIGGGNAEICVGYTHAHNVFINYLLETGFTGLLVLIIFFLFCLLAPLYSARIAFHAIHSSLESKFIFRACGLIFITQFWFILSNSSSDSMSGVTMPTFWFLTALAVSLGTSAYFDVTERKQDRQVPMVPA